MGLADIAAKNGKKVLFADISGSKIETGTQHVHNFREWCQPSVFP